MAPFKLKFRMGSSRSTSQEHDPDPQVNEALLANNHSTAIGASNSTIDSADCTSLGSLGTNERKSLLPPHKTNNLRLGYLNPNITQCNVNSTTTAASPTAAARVPQTPPPSYEHVLEENTRLGNNFDLYTPQRQSSSGDEHNNTQQQQQQQHSRRSSVNNLRNSLHLSPIEGGIPQCTDPDCLENLANEQHQQAVAAQRIYDYNAGNSSNNNEQRHHQQQRERQRQEIENDYEHRHNDNNGGAQLAVPELDLDDVDENDGEDDNEDIESDDNRKESIDSTELLISTNMTAPSSHENLLDNCNGECQHGSQYCGGRGGGNGDNDGESDFCDPLMNHNGYCVNDNHHYSNDDCQYEQHSQNQAPPEYTDRRSDTDSEDGGGCGGSWNTTQMSNDYQHHHLQQQQQQQQMEQQHYQQQQELRSQTPEIISNKSSKEIYKDLAKQWGITCKMSDGCRCMECQSHYFDCEYDEVSPDNEQQKTDGGLGAGTPMFISEVMHGSACTIL